MYEIKSILKEKVHIYQDKGFIYEREGNAFIPHSYKETVNDIYQFAGYLQSLQLSHKLIGIMADNSYNYAVADAAIMGFVGISVTISKDWTSNALCRMHNTIQLDAMIYSESQKEKVLALKEINPDMLLIPMSQVVNCEGYDLDESLIHYEDCCKIIFSSGSSGTPKAIMLSQKNMYVCHDLMYQRIQLLPEDHVFMFLPLHHCYGSVSNFLFPLIDGEHLYFCSDVKKIIEEIQIVKPTIFCTVPLVLEKVYAICQAKNIHPQMVFGGRLRHICCGGAMLDPKIVKYFKESGMQLFMAYGMSETTSFISEEYENYDTFDSVGTIYENIDLKIDQPNAEGIGEIILKGENVFLGYYGNQELTDSVFDKEGYFHTGDLGYIKNQLLYFAGRKKRVIVFANGENVYPEEIEALLYEYPMIHKASIYERDQKITATIYTSQVDTISSIIQEVNTKLPKYSRIQDYDVVDEAEGNRIK